MKTRRNLITLGMIAFTCITTQKSHAQWGYRCIYPSTQSTILSQHIDQLFGVCDLIQPTIVRGNWNGHWQNVDIWKGGYTRQVLMTTKYRLDHSDPCTGAWLWSEDKTGTTEEVLHFDLKNPNALDSNEPSYVANAPMTDEEVKTALQGLLQTCNKVHTGPWPQ